MIETRCHCGKVGVDIPHAPAHLTSCNCSICFRIGALWAYYTLGEVTVHRNAELVAYTQGDRMITFYSCAECGCTTHYADVEYQPDSRLAVNMRMAPRALTEAIRVRRFDGADTWTMLDPE